MPQTYSQSLRAMRISEVAETVGASRSSIYAWISKNEFPKPKKLGARRVGWLAADVENWLNSRPDAA